MTIKSALLKKLGLSPKTHDPINPPAPPDPDEDCANRKSKIVNAHVDWRNSLTNREPRGKVAHLPPPIREQVCEWISEGVTLQQIAKNLADIGHPGLNHQNISNWKENGYRTWCQRQEQLERARLRVEDSISFAQDPAYADGLLAAAEIRAANALEDAYDAIDPTADDDAYIKQAKAIEHHVKAYARLNQERHRSRKLKSDDQFRREKLYGPRNQNTETKREPISEEAQRESILAAVDKALGIKPYRPNPNQPTNSSHTDTATEPPISGIHPQGSVSICKLPATSPSSSCSVLPSVPIPPNTVENSKDSKAESCNNTVENQEAPFAIPSPGGEGQGEVGLSLRSSSFSVLPSVRIPPNTLENSKHSKAESCNNTVENQEAASAIPSPGGEGQGEVGFPLRSSSFSVVPDAALQTNPHSPPDDDAWERLLDESLITPGFIPPPPPMPRPYPEGAKPIAELPMPTLGVAYPPAPLLQPENKLALCNYNGVITAWVNKSEDPSKAKPWIQAIKNHKTGQTICWFDFHSRPSGMTDNDPVRGQPHFIPVFDANARIINWVPEPDSKHKRPPTLTAIPLESEYPQTLFAWLEAGSPAPAH